MMPSSESLIADLIELKTEVGRTPTKALVVGQGKYSPEDYLEEFGSWENALSDAGLDPEALDRERYDVVPQLGESQHIKIKMLLDSNEYDPFFRGQLLAEIGRLEVELGETPSSRDMRKYGRYSDKNYYTYFGTWTKAVEELGFTPQQKPTRISDLELLAELRRVAHETGNTPRTVDMRDHGKYSVPTYYDHFDSWFDACEQAGVAEKSPNNG